MSLRTMRSGVNNHTEKLVLQFSSDMVRKGGIISGFNCLEKSGGANMSVDVYPGAMYVKGSSSCYPIFSDSVTNVAVSLNSNANPLIGVIVCYNNLNITPNPTGEASDIPQFAFIAGTPATTPISPTDSEIKDVIGTNNPFERVCQVYVGSQVTAITNENLTDARRRVYVKTPRKWELVNQDGSSFTPDINLADEFWLTQTANITINLPNNMDVGDWLMVALVQNGTKTVSFASEYVQLSADMTPASVSGVTKYAINRTPVGYTIGLAGKQY